jgi:hypothetical protein
LCRALPVRVMRMRFSSPLCVFIFGMATFPANLTKQNDDHPTTRPTTPPVDVDRVHRHANNGSPKLRRAE